MALAVREEEQQRLLEEVDNRLRGRKLFLEAARLYDARYPKDIGIYDWQAEFHNAGGTFPERLLMAANRVGKTETGARETAIHATGEYPQWWQGKRWHEPIRAWTGAQRTEDSRDVVQVALLGPENDHGTGWIPRNRIKQVTYRQSGVSSVVDTIFVNHKSGGTSQITLKNYEMEAKGWRGKSLHLVWLDEEPKPDIYSEAQTRVLDQKGLVFITFTPVYGVTEVVRRFIKGGPGLYLKNVSWDDAPHLDEEEKKRLAATYWEHERDTRTKGMPLLGAGAIFPINDEDIICEPFEIPNFYRRINGVDFGINHPAAGAYCAVDQDADTFYVYDCYRKPHQTPVYHAAAMKKHGEWIPTAWPQDGMDRDKGSGTALKDQYRGHGLYMLRDYAQYPDGKANLVEPALNEMLEYMRTGRFKVFRNLSQWFEEKRLYHRDERGNVVKKVDDILCASRYAFMMRRFAKTRPIVAPRKPMRPILR